jgi:DNA replication and repair protein RecF
MLDSWNEQLTTSGSNLVYLRIRFLKELYPFAQHKCMQISSKQDSLSIEYDSTVGLKIYCHKDPLMAVDDIKRKYSQQIKQKTEEEIEKAQVLVGPHRDDIVFCLNEKEARAFASQGQQRTIVLSLKLSELELMKQSLEEEPLLLLDDVLAELDLSRQKYLFETITNGYQTIITTTDLDSFETAWLEEVDIIKIENGCVVNGKT